MTNKTNKGYYNKGNYNKGNYNTGNSNIGDFNTGNYNTGYYNAGHYNTGYYNTGYYNAGHYNTGYYNTGHYNTGDYHVGCFNTVSAEKAYYFNRLTDKSDWDKAEKPSWIYKVSPTRWVQENQMTAKEKLDNPSYKTTAGYLRVKDMESAWAEAYASASPEDIELTKALPAFDADVFLEITGIDLRDKSVEAPCEGREVEIDGVTYVLKLKGETE